MKLDYAQALRQLDKASGVWVCHGDEPLLQQNLTERFRQLWAKRGTECQRLDVQSVSDWKTVFAELDSLSLFATTLAIEVQTSVKPDASGQRLLSNFITDPHDNFLLILLPRQDAASLKSHFFKLISANATLVTLSASTRKQQHDILQIEAETLGLSLTDDAWQWLLFHHENNLLAARNTLLLAADRFAAEADHQPLHIDTSHLLDIAQDQSRFTVFDLSDACLKGDLPQAIRMADVLLHSESVGALFWAIQREMRLLLQLFETPHQADQIGIWASKVPMYQHALRRIAPQQLLHWPALLLRTDQAIKGISLDDPQQLMMQLVCALAGQPLSLSQYHTVG